MSRRFGAHIRSNVVGYVALFVALSGTAAAVDGPLAGQNTVGSADIINGEVQADDIKADSIGGAKIAPQSVKNSDLGLGASSSNTIADGGILGVDIKNGTVEGIDITNESVGALDLAIDAVPADGLFPEDGSTVLATDSVGSDEIKEGAVRSLQVEDGSLTGDDIADGAVTTQEVQNGSLTGADVLDGSLSAADIDESSLDGFGQSYTFHKAIAGHGSFGSLPLFDEAFGSLLRLSCSRFTGSAMLVLIFQHLDSSPGGSMNVFAHTDDREELRPEDPDDVDLLNGSHRYGRAMPADANGVSVILKDEAPSAPAASEFQIVWQVGGRVAVVNGHAFVDAAVSGDPYCEVTGSVSRGPAK